MFVAVKNLDRLIYWLTHHVPGASAGSVDAAFTVEMLSYCYGSQSRYFQLSGQPLSNSVKAVHLNAYPGTSATVVSICSSIK